MLESESIQAVRSLAFLTQLSINKTRSLAGEIPGMAFDCFGANLFPILLQVLKQFALEIFLQRIGKLDRIIRSADITSPALDDVIAKTTDIGSYHGEAKAVSQEQHSALRDFPIGKRQNISGLEIHFNVLIAHVPNSLNHLCRMRILIDCRLDPFQIIVASTACFAGNDEPITVALCRHALKRRHQNVE